MKREAKIHALALAYSLTMPWPLGEYAERAVSLIRTESMEGNMRVGSESMNVCRTNSTMCLSGSATLVSWLKHYKSNKKIKSYIATRTANHRLKGL